MISNKNNERKLTLFPSIKLAQKIEKLSIKILNVTQKRTEETDLGQVTNSNSSTHNHLSSSKDKLNN